MSKFFFFIMLTICTIEGGMICTNDENLSDILRCLRGHGLVREMENSLRKKEIIEKNPYLNPEFIFLHQGFNVRNNEISALIGLSQLKNLDFKIKKKK